MSDLLPSPVVPSPAAVAVALEPGERSLPSLGDRMPEGLSDAEQEQWCWDYIWVEELERRKACTHPGGYAQHDDEDECPVSPECHCGPFFDPFCPRHGDPGANLP